MIIAAKAAILFCASHTAPDESNKSLQATTTLHWIFSSVTTAPIVAHLAPHNSFWCFPSCGNFDSFGLVDSVSSNLQKLKEVVGIFYTLDHRPHLFLGNPLIKFMFTRMEWKLR